MKERKAVAIVIVWGVLIMLSMLAITALRLMGNQGFLTEASVHRTKAYYTAKAAMVEAFEKCRKSGCAADDASFVVLSLNNLTAKTEAAASGSPSFCPGCTTLKTTVKY